MRKIAYFCFIFLIVGFMVHAESFKELYSNTYLQTAPKEMTIGGTVGTVVSVGITGVTATGENDAEGFPFDLLGNDVLLSSGNVGRKIATWSVDANSNEVKLRITADHLKQGEDEVPYILRFSYTIPNENSGIFYVISSDSTGEIYDIVDGDLDAGVNVQDENGMITITLKNTQNRVSISDCDIRVFIPKSFIADLKDDEITPPGNYSAELTIEVMGE